MTRLHTAPTSRHSDTDLRTLFDLGNPGLDPVAAIAALRNRHTRRRWHYLGYPVAHDLNFPITTGLLTDGFYNNISTEDHWPPGGQHAMEAEIAVLDWLSTLFRIDPGNRWGHATTGGTGGNRAAIRRARTLHPDATLLYSAAAHYSIARAAADFRLPALAVPTCPTGEIDLDHLDETVGRLTRGKPAGSVQVIVAATWGTTFHEASDDLTGIRAVLDTHRVDRRYVHVDGALAAIPLTLDGHAQLGDADSVSCSGYKFLAVPEGCGIVIGRGTDHHNGLVIPYTDTLDATETGVRSGLLPAMMFESIAQQGRAGHLARAHTSRELADYTITRLADIGVPAWRNPSAYFTVVLPTPPASVLATWTLANKPPAADDTGATSHIVCVPGVTTAQIDHFINDLAVSLAAAPRDHTPTQRNRSSTTAAGSHP